jgi:RNA polymerase sigma factor (sigma-70 family)
MDDVEEFCLRVLGARELAADAAVRARAESGGDDRIALLRAAVLECRELGDRRDEDRLAEDDEIAGGSTRLAAAVARELAESTARLPDRQREALVLRELLRLSYEQIAQVLGIDEAAVAPLLARARMRLRAERRGGGIEQGVRCEDRERALRILASRQDSEPVSAEDDEWVLAHMAGCPSCETAHAAMLEASVCYRAWPRE